MASTAHGIPDWNTVRRYHLTWSRDGILESHRPEAAITVARDLAAATSAALAVD
ncbi:MAG: hypothetical protein OXN79_01715 [bacterium]|nr:hypothetical protein [bacterium]